MRWSVPTGTGAVLSGSRALVANTPDVDRATTMALAAPGAMTSPVAPVVPAATAYATWEPSGVMAGWTTWPGEVLSRAGDVVPVTLL